MSHPISTFSPRGLAPRIASGAVRLIDVRSANEFGKERIPDSENIPLNALDDGTLVQLKASGNDLPLCITCQSGVRAEKAAKKMSKAGIQNIYLLAGGLDNWIHEGMPVEGAGRKGIPLDRQVRITIGILVIAGTAAYYFSEDIRWLAAPAFLGAGLIFSGLTGFCGLARILSILPWNR
jgi:rhodanese-related sulfurtransferase